MGNHLVDYAEVKELLAEIDRLRAENAKLEREMDHLRRCQDVTLNHCAERDVRIAELQRQLQGGGGPER
jgi:hypothetical protein